MGNKSKRNIIANKHFNKPAIPFFELDLSKAEFVPKWMTRAYKNNSYIVMINDNAQTTKGKAICAMVQKHNDTPILNHWSEMQKIKNELFGKETVAIEYYPAESNLQNDHNIYWLWIFPEDVLPIYKNR